MSFPQPNSNSPVINGGKYFRLLTPVVSPGDIYQSEQSGVAFAVGPQSDIARYNVSYYDDDAASSGFMSTLIISNRAPFAGLLQARNLNSYQPANTPGKLLFSSADIIPDLAQSATRMIIPPTFDLVQYFSNPPATLPQVRNDKFYYLQNYPTGGVSYTVLLPYYGRVYADLLFGGAGAGPEELRVRGINYGIGGASNSTFTDIVPNVALGANGVHKIVTAAVDGMFDYLEIRISLGTGLSIDTYIRFSDVPQP